MGHFRKRSLPFGFISQLFIDEMIVTQIDLLFKVHPDINANALSNKPGKTENGFITATGKIAQCNNPDGFRFRKANPLPSFQFAGRPPV